MIMKKLFFIFTIMMVSLSVYAQKQQIYYKSTGTNVNIRKGPGTNYAVQSLDGGVHCGGGKAQLVKDEIVISDGKQRNGFIHVYPADEPCWEEGWVSAQYLTRATKCSACNGRGNTGRKCPECNGEGVYACCHYSGMEPCPKCWGIGYR